MLKKLFSKILTLLQVSFAAKPQRTESIKFCNNSDRISDIDSF
jgi:hypothetical protein